MKTVNYTITFICIALLSQAQIHTDSVKVFKANDTTYCLGVYGVLLPSGPCQVIDSSIVVKPDSVIVQLCYLYGDAANQICRGSDTIYLGNLPNHAYTVITCLASTDTLSNSCANPFKRDTIQMFFTATGIAKPTTGYLSFYPNPATNTLTIIQSNCLPGTNLQILGIEGKTLTNHIPVTCAKQEVDVSQLPAGMYFIVLQSGEKSVVRRFIKK